jgi:hypothetical protein
VFKVVKGRFFERKFEAATGLNVMFVLDNVS